MMIPGSLRLLHVGCGRNTSASLPPPYNKSPWQEIRLDIDPSVRPDIVASITDMGAVGPGSMHALWSSHNIEHLHPHEVGTALAEFHRVLVPNGFAVITTPDLERVAEAILQGRLMDTAYVAPAGPVAPIDMLYGYRPALARGQTYMAHRSGFTAASLEDALRQAGFPVVTVRRDGAWALWAVASRLAEDGLRAAQLADELAQRGTPAAA